MGNQVVKRNVKKRLEIQGLEEVLKKQEGAFFDTNEVCPLKHSFADGCYVREIFIPKGMVVVGKIHKHSHPNFLMKGEVIVATEEGEYRLKAPCAMISPAGTKRSVYTLEDTIWITVHVTDKKDLKDIEEEVIAKDFREIGLKDPMLDLKEKVCLG